MRFKTQSNQQLHIIHFPWGAYPILLLFLILGIESTLPDIFPFSFQQYPDKPIFGWLVIGFSVWAILALQYVLWVVDPNQKTITVNRINAFGKKTEQWQFSQVKHLWLVKQVSSKTKTGKPFLVVNLETTDESIIKIGSVTKWLGAKNNTKTKQLAYSLAHITAIPLLDNEGKVIPESTNLSANNQVL